MVLKKRTTKYGEEIMPEIITLKKYLRNYNKIILDFDGVIKDSVNCKLEGFLSLFPEASQEQKEYIEKHHLENGGVTRTQKIEKYYTHITNKLPSQTLLRELCEKFSYSVVDKVVSADYFVEIIDIINNTSADLYVASATPHDELKKILDRINIIGKFKEIFGSPISKSKAILSIIKSNDMKKEDIVFIGDSLQDYEAGKANHIDFIRAKNNFNTHIDVSEFNWYRSHV